MEESNEIKETIKVKTRPKNKTSLQVLKTTRTRLKGFKKYQRESYEEILNRLMDEATPDDTINKV